MKGLDMVRWHAPPPGDHSPPSSCVSEWAAISVPTSPETGARLRDLPIFRWAELRPPPSPRSLSPLLRHARWRACGRPAAALWRSLEAPGGQLRGQRRLGLGPGLPCLSLAGAPEPLGPPLCTCLPVDQGGRGGWSDGLAPTGPDERLGRACGEGSGSIGQSPPGRPSGLPGGWVVPPPWQGRSGERGGLVPPHGSTKYKLSS